MIGCRTVRPEVDRRACLPSPMTTEATERELVRFGCSTYRSQPLMAKTYSEIAIPMAIPNAT